MKTEKKKEGKEVVVDRSESGHCGCSWGYARGRVLERKILVSL